MGGWGEWAPNHSPGGDQEGAHRRVCVCVHVNINVNELQLGFPNTTRNPEGTLSHNNRKELTSLPLIHVSYMPRVRERGCASLSMNTDARDGERGKELWVAHTAAWFTRPAHFKRTMCLRRSRPRSPMGHCCQLRCAVHPTAVRTPSTPPPPVHPARQRARSRWSGSLSGRSCRPRPLPDAPQRAALGRTPAGHAPHCRTAHPHGSRSGRRSGWGAGGGGVTAASLNFEKASQSTRVHTEPT
jgi:hypothetical protein